MIDIAFGASDQFYDYSGLQQHASDSHRVVIELIRGSLDIDRKLLKNDELILLISVLEYY